MKGLILCAGNGNRLTPFSKTSPNELLTIANKLIHSIYSPLSISMPDSRGESL